MKRRKVRSQLEAMDQINITPLLDLTFNLLIVFMITTPLLENGIDVTPPTMTADQLPEDQVTKNLTITKDGLWTYENTPISQSELLATLQTLQAQHPDAVVLLRADGSRSYAEVIEVMDTIRQSGFMNVTLVTRNDGNAPVPRR